MIIEGSAPFRTDYQVCVVGAGPVGISLALDLARRGCSVVLLESGGRKADQTVQELAAAEIVNPSAHDSMAIATARRLGGTSNLWVGRCLPYDAVDFTNRPGVVEARWPIGLSDIAPYYEAACRYTDAGAADFEAPIPGVATSDDFLCHTLERWSNSPRLQVLHGRELGESEGLDVRLRRVVTGFSFTESGAVEEVQTCRPDGSDPQPVRAKFVVLAAGGVETARLLLAAQGTGDRFGGAGGPLGRYYMGHVVGQIADIALADQRLDDAFDFYVDKHGAYVRRRITPSAELQAKAGLMNCAFWPVVPPIWEAEHGSAILSSIYLALANPTIGARIIPEALRKRHMPPVPEPLAPHVWNVARNWPAAAAYVSRFMWNRHFARARVPGFFLRSRNFRYGLSFHSEQWPNPDSRITLTSERDRVGLPRARIAYSFHERDVVSILETHRKLNEWLSASGHGRLHYRLPPEERGADILRQAKHGAHQIGMTRMGAHRREGVVDEDLRTFDSPNLYVASSSVLPTSGQANPTLTAIALALRLSERLSRQFATS